MSDPIFVLLISAVAYGTSSPAILQVFNQCLRLPLPGVLEFGEAEAGLGFAFAGEKLLHQPFFMGLERVHFPRLRSDQLVHRTQALGDFLLFGG